MFIPLPPVKKRRGSAKRYLSVCSSLCSTSQRTWIIFHGTALLYCSVNTKGGNYITARLSDPVVPSEAVAADHKPWAGIVRVRDEPSHRPSSVRTSSMHSSSHTCGRHSCGYTVNHDWHFCAPEPSLTNHHTKRYAYGGRNNTLVIFTYSRHAAALVPGEYDVCFKELLCYWNLAANTFCR